MFTFLEFVIHWIYLSRLKSVVSYFNLMDSGSHGHNARCVCRAVFNIGVQGVVGVTAAHFHGFKSGFQVIDYDIFIIIFAVDGEISTEQERESACLIRGCRVAVIVNVVVACSH